MNKPTESVSNNSNNYHFTNESSSGNTPLNPLSISAEIPNSYHVERHKLSNNNSTSIRNIITSSVGANSNHHAMIASHNYSANGIDEHSSILPSIHNTPFQSNENVYYSKPIYSNLQSNSPFPSSLAITTIHANNNMQKERLPSINHVVNSSSSTIRNSTSPPTPFISSQVSHSQHFNQHLYVEDHQHSQYMIPSNQNNQLSNNNQLHPFGDSNKISVSPSAGSLVSYQSPPPTQHVPSNSMIRNNSKPNLHVMNNSHSNNNLSNFDQTTLNNTQNTSTTLIHHQQQSPIHATPIINTQQQQQQQDNYYHDFYVPIKKTNKLMMNNNNPNSQNATQSASSSSSASLIMNSSSNAHNNTTSSNGVPLKCSLCDRGITKRYWVRDCNVDVMKTFSKNEGMLLL